MDTGLTNGVPYYYVITAENVSGESGHSTEVTATPEAPIPIPESPTNVNAEGKDQSINLSWNSVTGAESYTIKRSTTSGNGYVTIASNITKTTYTDTGLTNGTPYYYVITAENVSGESGHSTEVTATPEAPIPIPEAPANVNAEGKDKSINLSWNSVTGAESYTIKRSTTSGNGYVTVASNLTKTTYTDTGLTNGVPYYYVITADNVSGESGHSTEVTATPKAPIVIPQAPSNVTAEGKDQSIQLSWGSVTGAESYIVSRRTTSSSVYVTVASELSETTYTDTGLVNGTPYIYVITAKNSAGQSGYSNEVTAAPIGVPEVPVNLTATGKNKSILLKWDKVKDAEGYNIKRSATSGTGYTTIAYVTDTTYTDIDLTNGTPYYYVISSVNSTGESNPSIEGTAIPKKAIPTAPANVTAKGKDKSIELSWDSVTDADSYNILRSTTSSSVYVTIASDITATTYTDTGLTNGLCYHYVLTAKNQTGESVKSAQVSAIPVDQPPASPVGLSADNGNSSVTLSWSKINNATVYSIKRSTTSGGPYTLVADTIMNNYYTDTGLTNGTSYFYIVSAKNEFGESEPSEEIEAIPGVPKPTNMITQVVGKAIRLSWDMVAFADAYRVKRAESMEGPFTLLSEGITGTNFTDENVLYNKVYYYIVTAVNSFGESQDTEPVSALVKDSIDKRYILLIALNNGMQKEYDIDEATASKFVSWYTARANGVGIPFFTLFNDEKEQAFNSSKDYIGYSSILYYQLNEYQVTIQE